MHQTGFNEKTLFAVVFLLIILLTGLWAQSQVDTTMQVCPLQIKNDFTIIAGLENPAWDQAPSIFIEHQVQPNDNAPAPVETEVKVLFSQHNLYIGFICKDPNPRNIRANVTDRDNSFQDDFIGVFIEPFNKIISRRMNSL